MATFDPTDPSRPKRPTLRIFRDTARQAPPPAAAGPITEYLLGDDHRPEDLGPAPDWIDDLIRGSAQHAAERMGLVPPRSANDPGPFRINLDADHEPDVGQGLTRDARQVAGGAPDEAPANINPDPDEVPF